MYRNTFPRSGSPTCMPITYGLKRNARLGSKLPKFHNTNFLLSTYESKKIRLNILSSNLVSSLYGVLCLFSGWLIFISI